MTLNALSFTRSTIYGYSLTLRIVLLVYGEWQDSYMEVKFTDVDYFVVSDAAEFVVNRESPYRRATYRYSPILAWLLIPNIYVHKAWGKLLFIFFDFVTAILIEKVLESLKCKEKVLAAALALWLFNPITMTVSCRGNAESIMSSLVIGIVYAFLMKKLVIAACLFAVAIHMKIYPIIYFLSLLMLCHRLEANFSKTEFNKSTYLLAFPVSYLFWINKKRLKFIFTFLLLFFALFVMLYVTYGYDFLEHTFLYHISRRDVKHNFSLHFYMMYLNSNQILGFVSFLSQSVILLVLSFTKYEDPPFCLFLLTHTFVTFNKVCTSQYFIWYLSLVPLLVPGFAHLQLKNILFTLCAWFSGQGLWLYFAYLLEFQGTNSFLLLWVASAIFFLINVGITLWCLNNYEFHRYFDLGGKLRTYNKKVD